jgi:AraC family transcriptional regulator
LLAGSGEPWRDIKASTCALPSKGEAWNVPSVSEPVLIWVISGEVEFQEREANGSWFTTQVKKGSFWLSMGGSPYDCRWRTLTSEPFEIMHVLIGLPILERALEEVFGADAIHAQLRDVSGFSDATLNSWLKELHDELRRPKASALFVQSVGEAIAIHLARNYGVTDKWPRSGSSSLPGYKVRQITDWMAEHLAENFDLAHLAGQAGLSKFHFHRLFKRAMGVSPSCYHVDLRMDAARRLLRETKKSVVAIALEVGYASPSHFAQLFRRKAGLSPSDYRRQR